MLPASLGWKTTSRANYLRLVALDDFGDRTHNGMPDVIVEPSTRSTNIRHTKQCKAVTQIALSVDHGYSAFFKKVDGGLFIARDTAQS